MKANFKVHINRTPIFKKINGVTLRISPDGGDQFTATINDEYIGGTMEEILSMANKMIKPVPLMMGYNPDYKEVKPTGGFEVMP